MKKDADLPLSRLQPPADLGGTAPKTSGVPSDRLRRPIDRSMCGEWEPGMGGEEGRPPFAGAYIESRVDIFGGEPVIRKTRITCRSILGRVDGGDTIEEICDEYRTIPREAFEAALAYARMNPQKDR